MDFTQTLRGIGLLSLFGGLCAFKCASDDTTPGDNAGSAGTGGTVASSGAGAATAISAGVGGIAAGPFAEHLYVSSGPTISVYEIGPGASDVPVRTIAGPNTKLGNVSSIAVDTQGTVYAANVDRDVTVYAPDADGDVAPSRAFAQDIHPQSISHGPEPTVIGGLKSAERADTMVFTFGGTPGSFVMPSLVGTWTWSPTPTFPIAAYGCAARAELPVVCYQFFASGGGDIYCPAKNCGDSHSFELSGRTAGGRTLTLEFTPDGALAVAYQHPSYQYAVDTYDVLLATAAQGYASLSLVRTLAGRDTGLDNPNALTFDKSGNMYVANRGLATNQGSVTVYPSGAMGNMAPIRTLPISGSSDVEVGP